MPERKPLPGKLLLAVGSGCAVGPLCRVHEVSRTALVNYELGQKIGNMSFVFAARKRVAKLICLSFLKENLTLWNTQDFCFDI